MRIAERSRATMKACALAISLGALLVLPTAHAADDERHSDLWLKASLVTVYTLNQHLNPFDIDVEVHDGNAVLRGKVDSSVEKDLASELARGVDGIRDVDNRLVIVNASADADNASRSGFMERVDDANITAKVKSQLLWNSNTQGLRIDVDTDGGVVTLRGEVRSDAESQLAGQIARNTSGVRKVENRLSVNPGQKSMRQDAEQSAANLKGELGDAWITTKVKTSLLYNRGVDAASVDVNTRDHVVTLRGEVQSPYEAKRAEQIAADIVGVHQVRNELRVRAQ